MDRGVRLLWQKFYAAWSLGKQTQPEEQQSLFPGAVGRSKGVGYLFVDVRLLGFDDPPRFS